jgi:hypothetical protein
MVWAGITFETWAIPAWPKMAKRETEPAIKAGVLVRWKRLFGFIFIFLLPEIVLI